MSKKQDKQLCEFISYYENKTISYDELLHIEIKLACVYSEYEFFIEKVRIVDNEEQARTVYDEISDNKINQIGSEEDYYKIISITWEKRNVKEEKK